MFDKPTIAPASPTYDLDCPSLCGQDKKAPM